jgi:hypothetical protein
MKKILDDLERLVIDFNAGKIDFYQYKSSMIEKSTTLNTFINFKYDLFMLIENWFEYVEFCYLQENWKNYSLELGFFLINGIKSYPDMVNLPSESIVVKEQFSRYLC